MKWLSDLAMVHPVAFALLALSIVIAAGLALGSLKVRGIGLGVAGVLFAGIVVGQVHLSLDPNVLGFVRDFGLILFVYTIGMQVGPSFLATLQRQGLPLNLLAVAIVAIGAVLTVVTARLAGLDMAAAIGLFAGATTNTPSLGAAQEALKIVPGMTAERMALPALGYAVTYPFGILGIILSMLALRTFLRIDPARETEAFKAERGKVGEGLHRMNVRLTNPNLDGLKLQELPGVPELGVVVSRIKPAHEDQVRLAEADTVVHLGDVLLTVGRKQTLEKFRQIGGEEAKENLLDVPGPVISRRVVVTRSAVLGKSLAELSLPQLHRVLVTRLARADIEMAATGTLCLQFGDLVQLVGEESALDKAAQTLGNSIDDLNHTNFIPVFLGIALGILAGFYPLSIPGLPSPVRLGLAGGPLLVAIFLSRVGQLGPLVWYMPVNANIALRELGISLFLASVGLNAGSQFVQTFLRGDGMLWMGCGAVITLVPLLVVGWAGRVFLKLNFNDLSGVLSGSMTDPPALAFANSISGSDAPSVAYATVYPLTMLMRILVAQVLVLLFCR